MIANQQPRLDGKVRDLLQEDEEVLVSVFGVRGFSKPTERRLKFFGFYFIGAAINLILADRIYFGLTRQRLLLLELTSRYLWYVDETEVDPSKVTVTEVSESRMYHVIDFLHDREDCPAENYRVLFPKWHTSFENNGDRARQLIDRLRQSSDANFPDAAAALVQTVIRQRDEQSQRTSESI
ncbi:MAG: hypothetical protein AAF961_12410, partial [Planctomycetota bacterium]